MPVEIQLHPDADVKDLDTHELSKLRNFRCFLSKLNRDTFGGLKLYASFGNNFDMNCELQSITRKLILVGETPETQGMMWCGGFREDVLAPTLRRGHIWGAKIKDWGLYLDGSKAPMDDEIIPMMIAFLEAKATEVCTSFNAFKQAVDEVFGANPGQPMTKVWVDKDGDFMASIETPHQKMGMIEVWRSLHLNLSPDTTPPHLSASIELHTNDPTVGPRLPTNYLPNVDIDRNLSEKDGFVAAFHRARAHAIKTCHIIAGAASAPGLYWT